MPVRTNPGTYNSSARHGASRWPTCTDGTHTKQRALPRYEYAGPRHGHSPQLVHSQTTTSTKCCKPFATTDLRPSITPDIIMIMKSFTSTLLTLGSVSTMTNAVAIDFYANRGCGLFSYSIDTPSEIGCTTLPETVSGLILRTDIPDGNCLINLFNDESCSGNTVQNFLNGDTQTDVCLEAPQLYVAYSATGC